MSQVNQVSQTGWQIFVEVPGKAPIELPTGESVIGRSRACLVQIAETTVSRQHAIFVVEPGKVRLRDLGSSNGTFVNGQRVEDAELRAGDVIAVGSMLFVVRIDGQPAAINPEDLTQRVRSAANAAAEPATPGSFVSENEDSSVDFDFDFSDDDEDEQPEL